MRAHLVGSVPLENAEQVFREVTRVLGDRLTHMPDGECGERSEWIAWQRRLFREAPFLQTASSWRAGYGAIGSVPMEPRPEIAPADMDFGPLGYAAAALQSYATFCRLQEEGAIPATMRMQVSLPTPLAPCIACLVPETVSAMEVVYARALRREVDEIVARIPSAHLAVQWDTALEFALLEGAFPHPLGKERDWLMERVVGLTEWIPREVPLGFHFCYGDSGHQHFCEPRDLGLIVQVANRVLGSSARPIQWLHVPVPRARDDAAYFAPLAGLRRGAETELYLGLLHLTDGAPGAARRIQAASTVCPEFGVATECGFGRRPPEDVPRLLRLHAEVCR